MRCSTSARSISVSIKPIRWSKRLARSAISNTSCFWVRLRVICEAMVSARRSLSSIALTVVITSEGIFLFKLTYWSNSILVARESAPTSFSSWSSTARVSNCVSRKCSPSTGFTNLTRLEPSTKTLSVPSGSLRSCKIVARVPIWWTSSSAGLSSAGSFWVTNTTCLSVLIPFSSANIDFSRPTNNGTAICGYTTTSRKGSKGYTFGSVSVFWESI